MECGSAICVMDRVLLLSSYQVGWARFWPPPHGTLTIFTAGAIGSAVPITFTSTREWDFTFTPRSQSISEPLKKVQFVFCGALHPSICAHHIRFWRLITGIAMVVLCWHDWMDSIGKRRYCRSSGVSRARNGASFVQSPVHPANACWRFMVSLGRWLWHGLLEQGIPDCTGLRGWAEIEMNASENKNKLKQTIKQNHATQSQQPYEHKWRRSGFAEQRFEAG